MKIMIVKCDGWRFGLWKLPKHTYFPYALDIGRYRILAVRNILR